MTTAASTRVPRGFDAEKTRKALPFFKIMAFIVGVGLLVLVVEMWFAYGMKMTKEENPLSWWPGPHGFIYMVYLAAVANLGFPARWSLLKMIGVMLAGCVPFLSFYVERKVARGVESQLAAAEA
ncbi:DUF3817 domain-containing protein [Mobilicoccus caccae]|uniref:Membrane protein n=1 Tax=Mobilicoccus caccae TaxID=1859295 RepID=A0ABQ6IKS3_9MICO|nr:DUF3817 domain-containing protein [Mobilicoccus caccae]GMA38499.1 membrane protein [Mobilicoccus caccae]